MEFILEFKKLAGDEMARRPLKLSQSVANDISEQLDSGEKYIKRLDERGNMIERIDKYSIKGIRPSEDRTYDNEYTHYAVCDYGTRHTHRGKEGFEDCNCEKRFKLNPFHFEKLMRTHFKLNYAVDITPEIQRRAEEMILTAKHKQNN